MFKSGPATKAWLDRLIGLLKSSQTRRAAWKGEGTRQTQCNWIDTAEWWYATLFLIAFSTICTVFLVIVLGAMIPTLLLETYQALAVLVPVLGLSSVGWMCAVGVLKRLFARESVRSIRSHGIWS